MAALQPELFMLRRVLRYALIAIVAIVAIRIALAVLGTFIGIAVLLGLLAILGYVVYAGLSILNPPLAARLADFVRGEEHAAAQPPTTHRPA